MARAARRARTISSPRLDLIEMIEKVRRQIARTQVRGSFRCAVTGPHVSDRKCKPKTTGGSSANWRIHTRPAGR